MGTYVYRSRIHALNHRHDNAIADHVTFSDTMLLPLSWYKVRQWYRRCMQTFGLQNGAALATVRPARSICDADGLTGHNSNQDNEPIEPI